MKMASFDLKSFFRCKKPRRSTRLEIKEETEIKAKTINNGPLGFFEIVPLELKFTIFTYLPLEELSQLTIVSKSMRNLVELYKNSEWAQRYLLPNSDLHTSLPSGVDQASYCSHFFKLGLLMKRSTCLYATKERLRIIHQFLRRYLCSFQKSCENPSKCLALACYGRFLHTVIAGWDDHECVRAFDVISQSTCMYKHLSSLVTYKAGAYPELEQHVRYFFRRVFLNQVQQRSDRAFWLHLILRNFPMVHQARILFLLYGPMCGNEIQWYEMGERTPVNKEQAALCFGELANSFRTLHLHSKEWTEDSIISVLDEMTIFPDDWLSENVASLLFLCGERLTLKVLCSKAINARVNELASLVTSLCLVCVRHEEPISWVVNIMGQVTGVMENTRDRENFLHGVVDMFKDIILDIHEFGDSDEESGQDLLHLLTSQASFMKQVLLLAFKNAKAV